VLRYIAFVCDGSEVGEQTVRQLSSKLAACPEWRNTRLGLRAAVFYQAATDDEVQLFPAQDGLVLGRVFKQPDANGNAPERIELDADLAIAIVRSAGRVLTDRYWGRYVALLQDSALRSTYVMRDPTGHLPCFRFAMPGVSIYFSDIADVLALGVGKFSINWRFVAAYLCNWRLQNHETGLAEVAEVQPGECMEHRVDGSSKTRLYWNPVEISRARPIQSFDTAVDELRRTTQACIWAWASCYPRVVHSLSGGLDSSIVLSCLHTAPSRPAITCVHYFHDSTTDADERAFARSAASHFNRELVERKLDASQVRLDAMLNVSKFPRPAVYQYSVQHAGFENDLALRSGASAIFKGVGGDQVFCQGEGMLAVADYVHARAFRSAWQLSTHVARAERTSVWSVLKAGLARGLLRRRWNPLEEVGRHQRLVRADVVASVRGDRRWIHPWLQSADAVAEGKLKHIETMLVPFDYYDPLHHLVAAERVHPLFSQPVMEACLRIPTYFMSAEGTDRAVARRAFAADLPRGIVARQGKAGFDSYLQQLLQGNLQFLRSLLLDGELVRQQLLDRHKVEAALASPRPQLRRELAELFVYHLSTEAWINSWAAR